MNREDNLVFVKKFWFWGQSTYLFRSIFSKSANVGIYAGNERFGGQMDVLVTFGQKS